MGLIEVDSKQPRLRLRVFRRADDHLILVWDKLPCNLGKVPEITAKCIEDGKELILHPNDKLGDYLRDVEDKVGSVIEESKNGMQYEKNYYVTVAYPAIRQSIKIFRTGVLPDYENENTDQVVETVVDTVENGKAVKKLVKKVEKKNRSNSHNFLWDPVRQMWRKQEGMVVDVLVGEKMEQRFAAITVVVPCPQCGYNGEK